MCIRDRTTSRGTKMPAYRIRWRDSERPEIVLQHMLIADPDPTPPPEGVSLEPPAPRPDSTQPSVAAKLFKLLLRFKQRPVLLQC